MIDITENMKEAQTGGGNLEYYLFISGISTNTLDNFTANLGMEINEDSTSMIVLGTHYYTGLIIVKSEVMEITSYIHEFGNTVCEIQRTKFNTLKSSHYAGETIYPVKFINNTSSYSYSQKSDVSDSTLISIALDTGSLIIKDDPLNWSAYNPNKTYNYSNYQPMFIFEGINNEVVKTFEGVTNKKFDSKVSKKITIEFKSKNAKIWKNSLSQSRMFYDNDLEDVLNYLYPEYDVTYQNGTQKSKLIKVKNMDLKNYTTHNDFLNAMCRQCLVRIRFSTNNRILVISDVYVNDIIPTETIYAGVTDISDDSSDLVFNKITGTYSETSEYRNNDDYRVDKQTNQKSQSADITAVQFNAFKDLTNVNIISGGEFQSLTVSFASGELGTSIVTYGDYCLLKETTGTTYSENGREFWCYVLDIRENELDLAIGSSKSSWLNSIGYINTIAPTGELSLTNVRFYYGFYELDIVSKMVYERNGTTRDNQLKIPILPFVFYNDIVTIANEISNDDELVYINGNWENVENYAKIESEYIKISGGFYDGTKTQCSIERGLLGTINNSHSSGTQISIVKYNNMLDNDSQFSFADIAEVKFSGLVSQIENIWDTWYDNSTLIYNKEFAQDIPIYLYSNKTDIIDNKIVYSGFDNSGIAVKYSRGDGNNDFNVELRNTVTTLQEGDLYSDAPVSSLASIITVSTATSNYLDVGDILKLKEVDKDSPNYTTYQSFKNTLWRVSYKNVNDIYLDNSWGSITSGMEFVVYKYSDVVYLQELFVRGNPIMSLEKNISLSDKESIDKYGEKSYTINGNTQSETDVRTIIDYFKNGYKGTTLENTRFKVTTTMKNRFDIEVLDAVYLTETIYSKLLNQKAICIAKDVTVNNSKRTEQLKFITIGEYSVNPSNIDLSTTLGYKTNVIPSYSHTGSELAEGTNDTVQDDKIINLTDSITGNSYSLKKIPTTEMSALVNTNFIDSNSKGVTCDIYQIKGLDLQTTGSTSGTTLTTSVDVSSQLQFGDYIEIGTDYRKISNVSGTTITVTEAFSSVWTNEDVHKNNYRKTVLLTDSEGVMSIKDEYIRYKVNDNDTITFVQRGLFDSTKVNINLNDQITFYSILSATLGGTQRFTELEAGDGVDNVFKFNYTDGFELDIDNKINFISGDNYFKMDKLNGIDIRANKLNVDAGTVVIKNSRNLINFETVGTASQILIDVTNPESISSTTKFKIGDYFGITYENSKIFLGGDVFLKDAEGSSASKLIFGSNGMEFYDFSGESQSFFRMEPTNNVNGNFLYSLSDSFGYFDMTTTNFKLSLYGSATAGILENKSSSNITQPFYLVGATLTNTSDADLNLTNGMMRRNVNTAQIRLNNTWVTFASA